MDIPDFFALDVGNHSIKVAHVRRQGDKASLQRIGSVKTEFGLLDNDSDEGVKRLAELVKQAREVSGITTINCVAAVPESPIFSRLITIPKVTEEQLQETVHWELKSLIPVPLDEVDVAFLEIGEKEVNGQKLIDMYVVAAPKTMTNKFKKVCEAAGLNLIALETESLANTRAVTYNYQTEKDIIICDFGASGTDLIIARNGIPVFAQSISTGSDALTKVIAADFGLDMEQAEKYKRAFGLKLDEGEGKIAKSIDPMMQIITSEMSRILTYFKERIGDTGASQIYMVGEAAKLPGLAEYFSTHLNLQAQLVDPTIKLEVANEAKKELEQLPSVGFSVAIGMGLKES